MPRFYLTTAIDYVNSRPHLGTAYEKIAADVIARYKRLAGFETRFVMGNDEHSQNVFSKAREQGVDPLAYCDRMAAEFRDVWERLDISFDDFIRTTEPRHQAGVQELVRRMARRRRHLRRALRGLVLRVVRGLQAGEGPRRRAVSDAPHEADWIRRRTTSSGCRSTREPLLEHYRGASGVPGAGRRAATRSCACSRAASTTSRSAAPGSRGAFRCRRSGSVVYVWFDALINYATAVGFGTDDALFEKWWPADLHVIGKDITRFHCVIWPAMLMSAGLPLPRQVFGHGWVHFRRREDEQVARHRDRSARRGRSGSGPIRCACTSSKEIALRRRRRLLLGALRGALQRRPRQQPRQPGQPRSPRWPTSIAAAGWRPPARPGVWPASRRDALAGLPRARWTRSRSRAARPRSSGSSTRRTNTSRAPSRGRSRETPAQRRPAVAGAVRRRGSRPRRRRSCCCR